MKYIRAVTMIVLIGIISMFTATQAMAMTPLPSYPSDNCDEKSFTLNDPGLFVPQCVSLRITSLAEAHHVVNGAVEDGLDDLFANTLWLNHTRLAKDQSGQDLIYNAADRKIYTRPHKVLEPNCYGVTVYNGTNPYVIAPRIAWESWTEETDVARCIVGLKLAQSGKFQFENEVIDSVHGSTEKILLAKNTSSRRGLKFTVNGNQDDFMLAA